MEHLICLCKMFGGTLGWPEWYTPALGPCFLFPKRLFLTSDTNLSPLQQIQLPTKDHILSFHMSILVFWNSLLCISMHLKIYRGNISEDICMLHKNISKILTQNEELVIPIKNHKLGWNKTHKVLFISKQKWKNYLAACICWVFLPFQISECYFSLQQS